jgi:tetratricopeptide (TPR) repeat protein
VPRSARFAALVAALALPATALAGPNHIDPPDTRDEGATFVEPTSADEWLQLGLSRYEAGDFAGAVDAFERGHAIDPRPGFLFAMAQAERRRGDCARAIVHYERFLASSPPDEQAIAAREQRDRCEQALGAHAESSAVPPTGEPTVVTRTVVVSEREAPWYTDPITDALAGGGAVLALVGVGLIASASSTADDAAAATTYDEHVALRDRAASRQTWGWSALGAGAVIGGVAVWRIFTGDRTTERAEPTGVTVAPGPGLGLALGGQF